MVGGCKTNPIGVTRSMQKSLAHVGRHATARRLSLFQSAESVTDATYSKCPF
jgi:hypothetical protein